MVVKRGGCEGIVEDGGQEVDEVLMWSRYCIVGW